MKIYQIEKIRDPRWGEFLERHPAASIFHSPGWLEALRVTYGYQPVVLTTSPPDAPLTNGLVYCQVRSWLTGRRAVSLPFSDYCQPLVASSQELQPLLGALCEQSEKQGWKYVEIRPSRPSEQTFDVSFARIDTFHHHVLDLRPGIEDLLLGLHKNSYQRKIRRAERERVTYEVGTSESILRSFYELQVQTRHRHGLPPQPFAWFRNLVRCLGSSVRIHLASKDERPIAAMLTLWHKQSVVYKYGASDARFHAAGAFPFLLWKVIEEAKALGLRELDLGRTAVDNESLTTFKDRSGAARFPLHYYKFPGKATKSALAKWVGRGARGVAGYLPSPVLTLAGRFVYRHIG